jgi:hypothetical protein
VDLISRLIWCFLSILLAVVSACSSDTVEPSINSCSGQEFSINKGNADWEWHKVGGVETITAANFNGDIYLATGLTAMLKVSLDGYIWTTSTYGAPESYYAMAIRRGEFISVGEGPYARVDRYGEGWLRSRYATGQEHTLRGISVSDLFVLAVGDSGEALKTQDGSNWEQLSGPTRIDLNSAYPSGEWHIVLGDSGRVYRTKDGRYWIDKSAGVADNFCAMAVSGDTRVLVTDAGSVFTTDYKFENWSKYQVSPGRCLRSAVWSYDRYVAVGDGGTIATSPDGHCWDVYESGLDADLLNVISTDKLVAVGTNGTILNSTDGIEWELRPPGVPHTLNDVIQSGNKFIAVGSGREVGAILTSETIDQWERAVVHGSEFVDLHALEAFGEKYYAVGSWGAVFVSETGEEWFQLDLGTIADLWTICQVNGRLLVGGDDGTLLTTLDGVSWEDISVDDVGAIFGIAASDTLVVAVSTIGRAHVSSDGYSWPSWNYVTLRLNDITWTGQEFIAIGNRDVFTSANGSDWDGEALGEGFMLKSIASGANKTVIVGTRGVVFARTENGWEREDSGVSSTYGYVSSIYGYDLKGVTAYSEGFVIVGRNGIVLTQ